MAELIDYFKTSGGQIIPYALINKVSEVVRIADNTVLHKSWSYWFRIYTLGDAPHKDGYGHFYTSYYRSEFEALVVKAALEGCWQRYRRYRRYGLV